MVQQGSTRSRRRTTAGLVAAAVSLAAVAVAVPAAGAALTGGSSGSDTSGASAVGLDNPYAGADQYVNVDWSAQVEDVAAPISSMWHFALLDAARQPTAVWLRSYADVTQESGLKHHLDAAAAQQEASGRPVVMTLVLDARPWRDCHEWEFHSDDEATRDLTLYQAFFLDELVELLTRPEYASLRIAAVVEPGAAYEVVMSTRTSGVCGAGTLGRATIPTLRADIEALAQVPNAYTYLDGGSAETLGWETPRTEALAVYDSIVKGTTRGRAGITGFAVGVNGYAAMEEPFVSLSTFIAGSPVRGTFFVDWRDAIDQTTLMARLRSGLASRGWDADAIDFIVDTSRNGWGGPDRPTGEGPSTSVGAYVDGGRLDRRTSPLMFCNQSGAGLGARPVAAPAEGIDAFVWVNNPGVSDGRDPATVPDEGKGFWAPQECGQTMVPAGYSGKEIETGALPSAPNAGEFFRDLLMSLAHHAYPALDDSYPWTTPPTSTTKTTTTTTKSTTTKTTKSRIKTRTKSTKPKTTKPKTTKSKTTRTKTTKPKTTKGPTTKR